MKKNDDWYAGEWKNGILTKVDLLKIIGTRLKRIRLDSGLNQNEFSSAFSTKNTTVSHWEHGVSAFDLETLYKLCRFFEVPSDYFMAMDDRDEIERKIFGYVYKFCRNPVLKYLALDFLTAIDAKQDSLTNLSKEEVEHYSKKLANGITVPGSEEADAFFEYRKRKYDIFLEGAIPAIDEYMVKMQNKVYERGHIVGYQKGYEYGKEAGYKEASNEEFQAGYDAGKYDALQEFIEQASDYDDLV